MASERSIIQPVFGLPRRKPSSDVLDTAETLVENLDSLADILDRLAEKYQIESKYTAPEAASCDGDGGELVPDRGTEHSLFSKLKTGLDSAKVLIDCLRREKGLLMKRQMSVECRLGEIEDYKHHMKSDLTSLNEMVDLLSLRIVQLESKLVDEQEAYESLEAEKHELEHKLNGQREDNTDTLSDDNGGLTMKKIVSSNPTSNLELENKELQYKVEILVVENRKLKEMIRKQSKGQGELENDLGTPRTLSASEIGEDGNNNKTFGPISDTDKSEV